MSKEKLYGLRDQLGKFLYDPTPDQAAWRDKMWEEGRFDEILKTTKQVEEQFDYVEKQIEAFEAAEPELGEKIVANTLLNLPLARGLKGTGLGSLLGIAEEELGAAETQRLDDIKKEINQLNAIRQRDLEGGKVTSGTISKIDADIRALENEGAELKQLLSTPLSEEPEDRKRRLFEEFIKDKTDLTFAEEEFLKAYPEFGSPSLRQLTPEQILEELGAQEGTVFDEELLKNAEGLAKSMGISTEDLQKALQQGEKEGLMSLISKTPTTGEVKPGTLIPSIKQELKTDLDLKKDYAEFFNPPTPIKGVKNVDIKKNLADFKKGKISASEAWENMSPPYTTEEINKLEKDEFKSAFRLAEEKWQETRSEYHKEAMRQLGVRAYGKGYLKGDIGWTDLGYQGGGLVMNYGDYGRSYT